MFILGTHYVKIVWIQENTDQKKLRIWTLFTQWFRSTFENVIRCEKCPDARKYGPEKNSEFRKLFMQCYVSKFHLVIIHTSGLSSIFSRLLMYTVSPSFFWNFDLKAHFSCRYHNMIRILSNCLKQICT